MNADDQPYSPSTGSHVLTPQIGQSFHQLPISLVVNLINGLILAAVLRDAAPASVLVSWLLLLFVVTGGRYLTLRAFRKAMRGTTFDEAVWTRCFVAGAWAAGMVWGASGIALFHPSSFPHQVFLIFVLGGMVAGAVPVLSSMRYAYWCFALPAVLPISIKMLSMDTYVHLVMGLMIAIFGIAMLASSARVHRLFHEADVLRRRLFSALKVSQSLEHLVRLDSLTEIPNRRFFEEELAKEWGRAERHKESIAVIIADIDHFKEYNDHYGHPVGDGCLVSVAQTLQRALYRPGDVVARIGGEEFAFLLPRTNSQGAMAVAKQLHDRILGLNMPHEASPVAAQITLSFGVSASDDPFITSPADLIRAADAALYEAKGRGRNRIAMYESQGTFD